MTESVEDLKKEIERLKEQLEKEKNQTTAQLKTMKDQYELITAMLPKTEVKTVEGKIVADEKFGHVTEQMCYQALEDISSEIAQKVTDSLANVESYQILIVDQPELITGELSAVEMGLQFDYFSEKLKGQNEKNSALIKVFQLSQPPGIALPEAGIRFVPALLPMAKVVAPFALAALTQVPTILKTDYSVKGFDCKINQKALISALVKNLTSKFEKDDEKRQVKVLSFYYLYDKFSDIIENSVLFKKYVELTEESNNLSISCSELQSYVDTELGSPELIKKAKLEISASEALSNELNTNLKKISEIEGGKTCSQFTKAMLRDIIAKEDNYYLYVDVVANSGEVITKQSLLSSGNVSYLSGVVLCYFLVNSKGDIEDTETIPRLVHCKTNISKITGLNLFPVEMTNHKSSLTGM